MLPGRTPNTLKNFWHSNLRALAMKELFGITPDLSRAESDTLLHAESATLIPRIQTDPLRPRRRAPSKFVFSPFWRCES